MKKILIVSVIGVVIFAIMAAAQINYECALLSARKTSGSDSAIEQAMLNHGFNADANDLTPVKMGTKITALKSRIINFIF